MTNFRRLLAAGVFALPLLGCQAVESAVQNVGTVSDAQTAVGKAAVAVTAIGDPSVSTLSKAQAAACAGQAVANAVGDMLVSTGHQGAANNLSKVSTVLGDGCTWTLPPL